MLQSRRSYKALSLDVCLLCMEGGETIDHIFLNCLLSLGLWHGLFDLVHIDWVPPKSICDMMIISYKRLGNTRKGKVLWQFACLALMWVMWQDRNVMIFQDKARTSECLWDIIHFLASFWASCITTFKGVSHNLIQLDSWRLVCGPKGGGQQGQIIFVYSHMGHSLWILMYRFLDLVFCFLFLFLQEDLSSSFVLICIYFYFS